MPAIGAITAEGKLTFEELRRRVQEPLHPFHYTPDMIEAVIGAQKDEPGSMTHTATRIMGCARRAVLESENDYYIDLRDAWASVRGNMIHALMERATYPGAEVVIREQRLSTTVDTKYGPQRFTSKPDVLVVKTVRNGVAVVKIVDYKSKKEVAHDLTAALPDNVRQVNMYAWLVERELPAFMQRHGSLAEYNVHRAVVDELEIVYCDMRKVRRFTSAGPLTDLGKMTKRGRNPEYEVLTLAPIEFLPRELVERFIVKRVEARIRAQKQLPPPLQGEAAWICNWCPVRDVCERRATDEGEALPGTLDA